MSEGRIRVNLMKYENDKYKDLSPGSTIEKAKECLRKLGIQMHEELLCSSEHLYSMRLQDDATGWGTNGKGTTEEYCRASAYGEALERIQNLQLPDRIMNLLTQDALKYQDFLLYPDEIKKTIVDILKDVPELKEDMKKSYEESDGFLPSDDELIKFWTKINGNELFECIPFYDLKGKDIVYLPAKIIKRLCRSNGLAAGNSPEEAICQALSEILERYVQEFIYRNGVTPPQIPEKYIKETAPELLEIVREIENKGKFKIHIMDGSLGKGLPVVILIQIDYGNQRYRIKFGSHPIFRIALERCLTELAQGNDFSEATNAKLMMNWTRENQANWDTLYNWSITHRRNEGVVPDSIFVGNRTWEFQEWKDQEDFTNKKGLRILLNKVRVLSNNIYIRDNSFLNFHAYRIYIPEISTTYKFHPAGEKVAEMESYAKVFENLPIYAKEINDKDKLNLIQILEADHLHSLTERIKVTENILLAALYADSNQLEKAVNVLRGEKISTKYVAAVIRELEMRMDGISESDRNRMLELFFGSQVRNYVVMNWRGNVLSGLYDPFRVNEIRGKKVRDDRPKISENISKTYCKIKDAMRENIIDQHRIEKVLQ